MSPPHRYSAALLVGMAILAPLRDAPAADLASAVARAGADVREAAEALASQRDAIAEERRPLAAEADALQREVAELRRSVRDAQLARERLLAESERLEAANIVRERELGAVEQTLNEYRRALETRISRAESLAHEDQLAAMDALLADTQAFRRLPEAAGNVWEAALSWADLRLGGMRWTGQGLNAEGVQVEGWFLSAGPAVWFVALNGNESGIAVTRAGSALPSLAPRQPGGYREAYLRAAAGEVALLPVDLSGGDALRRMESRPGWMQQLRAGGAVMIPLLVLGAVALVLAVTKTVTLKRTCVDGGGRVPAVLRALASGGRAAAREEARRAGLPLRDVLLEGIEHAGAERATLEELLHERVLAALPHLERHLGTLAVLGGVAPLLGLLGTVTGMIHTFRLITLFGTGDARLLSGGISEALVTTQFGLFIAIPTLLAHAYLVRRVRDRVGRLEDAAVAFVHGLTAREPAP